MHFQKIYVVPVSEVPYLRLKDVKHHQKPRGPQASNILEFNNCTPSAEELSGFYTELVGCSKKSIILSTVAPHNGEFVQSIDHLPKALQSLYDPNKIKVNFI